MFKGFFCTGKCDCVCGVCVDRCCHRPLVNVFNKHATHASAVFRLSGLKVGACVCCEAVRPASGAFPLSKALYDSRTPPRPSRRVVLTSQTMRKRRRTLQPPSGSTALYANNHVLNVSNKIEDGFLDAGRGRPLRTLEEWKQQASGEQSI